MNLVRAAIMAGVMNDLGSGRYTHVFTVTSSLYKLTCLVDSNVDITVITAAGVERFRNIDKAEPKYKTKSPLVYAKGTTGDCQVQTSIWQDVDFLFFERYDCLSVRCWLLIAYIFICLDCSSICQRNNLQDQDHCDRGRRYDSQIRRRQLQLLTLFSCSDGRLIIYSLCLGEAVCTSVNGRPESTTFLLPNIHALASGRDYVSPIHESRSAHI
jgi:hypothetical protein